MPKHQRMYDCFQRHNIKLGDIQLVAVAITVTGKYERNCSNSVWLAPIWNLFPHWKSTDDKLKRWAKKGE